MKKNHVELNHVEDSVYVSFALVNPVIIRRLAAKGCCLPLSKTGRERWPPVLQASRIRKMPRNDREAQNALLDKRLALRKPALLNFATRGISSVNIRVSGGGGVLDEYCLKLS
jgi:hypothetical protein